MPVQHGPKSGGRDAFDNIWDAIEKVAKHSQKVKQQMLTPTLPLYDSYVFPQHPVEGQKCVDYRGSEWFFFEKCWREVTSLSFALCEGGVVGGGPVSVPPGIDYTVPFSGISTSNKRAFGNDPSNSTWNDSISVATGNVGQQLDTIFFNTTGIYLAIADVRFQGDGAVYTKQVGFHTNGPSIISESNLFVQTTPEPMSYDPGISPMSWTHLMKWTLFIGFHTGGIQLVVRQGAAGNKSIGGAWVPDTPPNAVIPPRLFVLRLGNPFSISPGENPDGSGQHVNEFVDPTYDPLHGVVSL